MQDRRRYPRLPDRNSVAVTIVNVPAVPALEGKTYFCLTTNVSAGGIMLFVGTRVPPGSTMELRIAFREPIRSFEMTGRVAWSGEGSADQGYPIGVEFVTGRAGDMEAWREIVARKIAFKGLPGSDTSP